jgi:hypothetical protein
LATKDVEIPAISKEGTADRTHRSTGDDGMKEYGWRMSRPAKSKAELPAERKLSELLKSCFRIYFPSRETVENSKGGLGVSYLSDRWPHPMFKRVRVQPN